MSKNEDLTGKTFGRLTVIQRDKDYIQPSGQHKVMWLCECICGNKISVQAYFLKKGYTKSCGCLRKENSKKIHIKHGLYYTKIRGIWGNIKQRCYNKNSSSYKYYGERNIKICDEWLNNENGFINFYNWAMHNGYKEGLTIDRINVNGNYEPSNCRWSNNITQANNKRNNIYIEYKNETKTLAEWCKELNMNYNTVRTRIYELGWTPQKAFETNINIRNTHPHIYIP